MARAHSRRRLTVLLAAYLAITLLMGWRLVTIQVVDAAEYRSLAAAQSERELELPASRGKLYARGGEPLAMSLTAATIYADPRALRQADHPPAQVAAALAPLLNRRAAELTRALSADSGFVYLARQLPRRVGEQVADMELPGVGVLHEAKRLYPAGSLAAQTIGFAGVDGEGLSGLELSLERTLAGRPGTLHLAQAPGGLEISAGTRQLAAPIPGDDVVLTLDREVQSVTERLLAQAVERYRAKGGSAIVMDARSGELLAMANVPTYDPTEIADASADSRRNRVITDIFEPGSVNKVVTASAALEEGAITLHERLKVPGSHRVGEKVFSDSYSHETERMRLGEIIERSSNIGTIKIAERLGADALHDYLRRFGYGAPTGLGFPGEAAGLLTHPATWWDTSLPTISIGQGVSATLLQVASVFQTVANGGTRVEPTLVRGTVGADGRLRRTAAPDQRRVISPATATAVSEMLVRVVHGEGGTCELCAVPGYRVGGKTGTAEKPSQTRRGYEPGAYIASFVGFAPAEDPALVVGVSLDEAQPYYGGLSAGPAFSDIMSFALRNRGVASSSRRRALPAPAPVSTAAATTPQGLEASAALVPGFEALPAWATRTAAPAIPRWARRPARP